MPFRHLLPLKYVQSAKAAVLVGLGLGWSARRSLDGTLRILTFHGLTEGSPEHGPPLDDSLHLPVELFEAICRHLAGHYTVIPLLEAVAAIRDTRPLPTNAVAITFDDGYRSNHELALPVLQSFNLPATIFLTTAFVDGTDPLWFQRVDWALATTARKNPAITLGETRVNLALGDRESRQKALAAVVVELKKLPRKQLLASLDEIDDTLGVTCPDSNLFPAPMRPLTWNQIRAMQVSGLVEFGGHTHHHPIMARCAPECVQSEIETCRDRMATELGRRPQLFAYPNGGLADFDTDCERLLRDAGFIASFSTIPKPVDGASDLLRMPRFGSPESVIEAEATVSGAFTVASRLKKQFRPGKG